jgi:prepilin-type N-terminal cleavage/methylation domain-containing protein
MFGRNTTGPARNRRAGVSPVISFSQRLRRFRAFALMEVLVAILVIGILASLLLPALGSAKAKGRRAAWAGQRWRARPSRLAGGHETVATIG